MIKLLLLLIGFSLSTSCSLLSPVKGPDHTYMLNAAGCPNVFARSNITLFVAPVDSTPIYNTNEIAYTNRPYQISFFAKNGWVAPPAQMLQPLLIQTLQNTHFFRAISTLPTQYDYALNVQLIELRQNFLTLPSRVELKLRAQLISGPANEMVATREFCIVKTAPCNNPYGGVIAANEATAEALTEISLFTIRTIRNIKR